MGPASWGQDTMAWVAKDHSAHPVPTPCYVQGRQPADQAAVHWSILGPTTWGRNPGSLCCCCAIIGEFTSRRKKRCRNIETEGWAICISEQTAGLKSQVHVARVFGKPAGIGRCHIFFFPEKEEMWSRQADGLSG